MSLRPLIGSSILCPKVARAGETLSPRERPKPSPHAPQATRADTWRRCFGLESRPCGFACLWMTHRINIRPVWRALLILLMLGSSRLLAATSAESQALNTPLNFRNGGVWDRADTEVGQLILHYTDT